MMAVVHVGTTMNADSVPLCTVVKVFRSCKANCARRHSAAGRDWRAAALRRVDSSFLVITEVFMSWFCLFLCLSYLFTQQAGSMPLIEKVIFQSHQSNIHNLQVEFITFSYIKLLQHFVIVQTGAN